jgi:hypothetical protein
MSPLFYLDFILAIADDNFIPKIHNSKSQITDMKKTLESSPNG